MRVRIPGGGRIQVAWGRGGTRVSSIGIQSEIYTPSKSGIFFWWPKIPVKRDIDNGIRCFILVVVLVSVAASPVSSCGSRHILLRRRETDFGLDQWSRDEARGEQCAGGNEILETAKRRQVR